MRRIGCAQSPPSRICTSHRLPVVYRRCFHCRQRVRTRPAICRARWSGAPPAPDSRPSATSDSGWSVVVASAHDGASPESETVQVQVPPMWPARRVCQQRQQREDRPTPALSARYAASIDQLHSADCSIHAVEREQVIRQEVTTVVARRTAPLSVSEDQTTPHRVVGERPISDPPASDRRQTGRSRWPRRFAAASCDATTTPLPPASDTTFVRFGPNYRLPPAARHPAICVATPPPNALSFSLFL